MLSYRLFMTREPLVLSTILSRHFRTASHPSSKQHNFQSRQLKKKTALRKPIPFSLATSIHASMIERLDKMHRQRNLTSDNLSNGESIQRSVKTTGQLCDEEWHKELKELSTTLKKIAPDVKRTSSVVLFLEEKFRQQISEYGLQKSLQIADIFFSHKYRQQKYLTYLFEYAVQKGYKLVPAHQITHLMFYVFFHGNAPPVLYYQLEEYIENSLQQFDVNDLGIICLGYFRGNRRIQSHDLLDKMSERVLENFHDLNENMLINILKTFRHSGFAKISFFETLSEKLLESSFLKQSSSLNNLMHITMTYACTAMCCKQLNQELLFCFVKLVQRYQGTKSLRSKDIAKFVWAMGTFVHEPHKERQAYMKLVEAYDSVNKQQEKEHPESLADMLQGLTYLGIHPHHLMDRILRASTAKSLKDNAVYGKVFQLLLFHNTVLIECPDYKGRLLSEGFLRSLHQLPGMTGNLDFEMKTRQGLREIHRTLLDMLGSRMIQVHFIFPHFTLADIELRLDDNNQPIEFTAKPSTSVSQSQSSIHTTVTDNLLSSLTQQSTARGLESRKIVVEVLGQNQYFSNIKELTGNIQTKLRQLRTLGYTVIMISADEASKLATMSEEDRRCWLCQKLKEELGLVVHK